MELIKIKETENGRAVSARDLHEFIGSKQDFSTWIKNRIKKYDLIEGEDFTFHKFVERKATVHEYILSMDCAKELAMIENNDKGRRARKYFIACEKKLKEVTPPKIPTTMVEALALALLQAKELEKKTLELTQAEQTIETNKPKVVFANSVMGSSNSILVRQFAKDLCDGDFKIGQNKLFKWFRDNGYLNRNNEPYQNYIDQGLFEVVTRSIGTGSETFTSKTTKITGKGAVYFTKKIKS